MEFQSGGAAAENRDLCEKQLDSRLIYDGTIVHLYRDTVCLPNGREAFREVIRHNGAVAVVALFDDGTVLMEEQFRYPLGQVLLEIPAGKLDGPDEDPCEAARRELREETGFTARQMTPIGDYYPSPAILSEVIHLYVARGLSAGERSPDEDEFLRVRRMPLSDLIRRICAGEIPDGKTQTALLRVAMQENLKS